MCGIHADKTHCLNETVMQKLDQGSRHYRHRSLGAEHLWFPPWMEAHKEAENYEGRQAASGGAAGVEIAGGSPSYSPTSMAKTPAPLLPCLLADVAKFHKLQQLWPTQHLPTPFLLQRQQ